MMNKSKTRFKAYDRRQKKVIEDALILNTKTDLVQGNVEYFTHPLSFLDGCVWMQHTGWEDSNGEPLFEEDVVEFEETEFIETGVYRPITVTGSIKFVNAGFYVIHEQVRYAEDSAEKNVIAEVAEQKSYLANCRNLVKIGSNYSTEESATA